MLPRFDRIIAHNAHMCRYLSTQGVPEENLVSLGLFDYLAEGDVPVRTLSPSVCIAGNLARRKSRYLHSLPRTRMQWHLYGEGWKGKKNRTDITAHGMLPPDELPNRLEGSFGLVWDGASTEVCSGYYGAYQMINNPHKLSLYLAAGMPVVVWKWSAQADFVREAGVGLVIDRLPDLPGVIAALSPAEYDRMAANARRIGTELRTGARLQSALKQIERI